MSIKANIFSRTDPGYANKIINSVTDMPHFLDGNPYF